MTMKVKVVTNNRRYIKKRIVDFGPVSGSCHKLKRVLDFVNTLGAPYRYKVNKKCTYGLFPLELFYDDNSSEIEVTLGGNNF